MKPTFSTAKILDFCYRIRQAGYQIIYYPHVEVLHYKGASSGLRKESAQIAKPPKETRVRVAKESVRGDEDFLQQILSAAISLVGNGRCAGRYPSSRLVPHPQTPTNLIGHREHSGNRELR